MDFPWVCISVLISYLYGEMEMNIECGLRFQWNLRATLYACFMPYQNQLFSEKFLREIRNRNLVALKDPCSTVSW